MRWASIRRRLLWCLAGLFALELLYLVGANLLLSSGAIERATRTRTSVIDFEMAWTSAWSPWPGRVHVRGLTLWLQDPVLEFQLSAASARLDIVLWELARKKFRAPHTQAEGVSYRFVTRLNEGEARAPRVAAFPPIRGFASPPRLANPAPPPFTEAEIDAMWEVELNQVD